MVAQARLRSLILVGALAVTGTSVGAQNVDSIRKTYQLPVPVIGRIHPAIRATPGSSVQSPTAYGPDWGAGYVGAGFQSRMRYVKDLPRSRQMDGAVMASFGFGDSKRYVGLEAVLTSFSTVRSGFGNHSSVSFKLHRLLPNNFAVAAGWEDAVRTPGTDGGTSGYAVVSHEYKRLEISGGIGGGRFKTESAIDANRKGVNAFGTVGYQVASPLSLIADWAGQDLALGASIVPLKNVPIYIEPAFVDLTGSAGDGARFVLGVGVGFSYRQLGSIFGTH